MARPRKNASSSSNSGGSETRLSSGQASYVLDRLLSERRISQGEVNRYVSEMGREISDLEERLRRLREAHGGQIAAAAAGIGAAVGAAAVVRRGRRPGRPPGRPGRPAGRPGRPPGRPAASANTGASTGADNANGGGASAATAGGGKRGRKRTAITSEQLASRQLQGRYLALVRQFAEGKRAQYAKIAKEKGREAAIKEMQDALKK